MKEPHIRFITDLESVILCVRREEMTVRGMLCCISPTNSYTVWTKYRLWVRSKTSVRIQQCQGDDSLLINPWPWRGCLLLRTIFILSFLPINCQHSLIYHHKKKRNAVTCEMAAAILLTHWECFSLFKMHIFTQVLTVCCHVCDQLCVITDVITLSCVWSQTWSHSAVCESKQPFIVNILNDCGTESFNE